jgi:hypothetical protein
VEGVGLREEKKVADNSVERFAAEDGFSWQVGSPSIAD